MAGTPRPEARLTRLMIQFRPQFAIRSQPYSSSDGGSL